MGRGMYEVLAVRYATFAQRRAHDNFIVRDMRDGPMPLDYYVWVQRGSQTILVDTGFNREAGRARNRGFTIEPEVALKQLGIDLGSITDMILTHLHCDHAGNLDKFPQARFHVQVGEMTYAVGPCMCHGFLRHPFDVEPIVQMVRFLYAGRVVFHEARAMVAPGVEVCRVGGHSDGLQVVCVETARGPLVLASDALHFFDNMLRRNPFPLAYNIGDTIREWDIVLSLACDPERVIAGHDPLVGEIYPRLAGSHVEAFTLHSAPQKRDDAARLQRSAST